MPRIWDAVGAVLLAALWVPATLGAGHFSATDRQPDAVAIALVVSGALSLAWLRAYPLMVLGFVTVGTTAYLWREYPYGPVMVTFLLAVFGVAATRRARVAIAAAGLALIVLLSHILMNDSALPGLWGLVPGSAWVVVPVAVGIAVRMWRENVRREREEGVRREVDAERLRVAREVHDVVGHGLAAIHMQAGVALYVLAKDPSRAEGALRVIHASSAAALEELRATLAVVRGTETRRPQPGLDALDDLFARMRDSGVRIAASTRGTRRPVPGAVGFAAYRVVQEALTNVLKHGARPEAAVIVTYSPGAVEIVVINPFSGAPVPPGTGISGMRERVEALGGHLVAGPTGDGRFEVAARLPTEEQA